MKFFKNNANNLVFHNGSVPRRILSIIKKNINNLEKDNNTGDKILRLHTLLSRQVMFNTSFGSMYVFGSGVLKVNGRVYYIISSEDNNNIQIKYTYIFEEKDDSEDDSKTKYIGRVEYRWVFKD